MRIGPSGDTHGRHFYCYPQDPEAFNGKLSIHLVGTYGDPGVSHDLSLRACSLGFAAVAPLYVNSASILGVCGNDSGCYEAMRREILYGDDWAPDPVSVDRANSVVNRTTTLVGHLARSEADFPAWQRFASDLSAGRWNDVTVSGHSQGSGHALLLARDRAVDRIIMLAGVPDRLNFGQPDNAPVAWVERFRSSAPKTDASRFYGYNHEDDLHGNYPQISSNYDSVGVSTAECVFRTEPAPGYASSCRRVHVPPAGCAHTDAHFVVTAGTFGNSGDHCAMPGSETSNAYTWQFLLTAP